MALNIEDDCTDRLARELSRATGESITSAVRTAIEERLARVLAQRERAVGGPALPDIVQRGRARTQLRTGSADEIVGYDQHGLPA